MKLKRICKVEYDENDKAIIPQNERLKYDVYFIDNDDFLCIDEDDYTQEKFEARLKERAKFRLYKDNGSGLHDTGYVYAPYTPIHIPLSPEAVTAITYPGRKIFGKDE